MNIKTITWDKPLHLSHHFFHMGQASACRRQWQIYLAGKERCATCEVDRNHISTPEQLRWNPKKMHFQFPCSFSWKKSPLIGHRTQFWPSSTSVALVAFDLSTSFSQENPTNPPACGILQGCHKRSGHQLKLPRFTEVSAFVHLKAEVKIFALGLEKETFQETQFRNLQKKWASSKMISYKSTPFNTKK